MNVSHSSVHPVEAPALTGDANNAARVRMKDIQGMPGTPGGLALRFCQFLCAAASLCFMATTSDFTSVTAFRNVYKSPLGYSIETAAAEGGLGWGQKRGGEDIMGKCFHRKILALDYQNAVVYTVEAKDAIYNNFNAPLRLSASLLCPSNICAAFRPLVLPELQQPQYPFDTLGYEWKNSETTPDLCEAPAGMTGTFYFLRVRKMAHSLVRQLLLDSPLCCLESLWSLSLAIVDLYALLVRRCLRNSRVVSFFTIGDGIMSTLTFAAACASAGITVLIGNDLDNCAQNHCTRFETATAMAFISWFTASPSFLLNFWSLASQ
ncbi:hypothetical protein HHK36_018938 [Tetracentron sinense]|uniref:CASP-like protein n=1 Tax=Tetracentron sinense TaxID=13715 RepID=A0A835DCB8_TETSI|nr:hypothetical protein HHK36_018938 [Tetracentron sinense]